MNDIDYKIAFEQSRDNAADLAELVLMQGKLLLACRDLALEASSMKRSVSELADSANELLEAFREFEEEG